jgi:protein phosphatase
MNDEKIEQMLQDIHKELVAEAFKRGTPKMGSTLVGIVLQEGSSGFFNAGDSRVYRFRHGYLQQLSNDDSLAALVPGSKKNVIINAVGAGRERMSVASRFSESMAVKDDVFLLCSDGVHGAINDDDLAFLLGLPDKADVLAKTIVEQALKNNSDDNCTAVVVKIEEKE